MIVVPNARQQCRQAMRLILQRRCRGEEANCASRVHQQSSADIFTTTTTTGVRLGGLAYNNDPSTPLGSLKLALGPECEQPYARPWYSEQGICAIEPGGLKGGLHTFDASDGVRGSG